jgi:signal transduction histidine kinase
VLVCIDGPAARALPRQAVLYRPGSGAADLLSAQLPPEIREVERAELAREDYAAAARGYEQLLRHATGAARAPVLLRLARTLDKSRRQDEAARRYAELATFGDVQVGSLPAGLVGLERTCDLLARRGDPALAGCAARLRDGLRSGRWDVEQASYVHYRDRATAWLQRTARAPGAPRGPAQDEGERAKELLSAAAAWAASQAVRDGLSRPPGPRLSPDGGAVLLSTTAAGSSATHLILTVSYLSTRSWARAFSDRSLAAATVIVTSPGGENLFASGPAAAAQAASATASVRDTGWRAQVAPRDPAGIAAAAARRRNVYLAMLVLMGLSLAFGGTLAFVTVRRERAVSALQSQFVSTVSHEFRSPLTAIQQLLELLARGRVAEENRQEYYDTLVRESHRLSRLVENVLDFSRMEDRRRPYRFEPLDTSGFLAEVADTFRLSPLAGQATVVVRIPDALPSIRADRDALARALQNLLDNAVKYSAAPATVELDAEPCEGGAVRVRIRDRGVGIPRDEQPRVFDRFFRGRETAATVKGTGLGLSIVKHVADAHDAAIAIESEPGAGTTVTLTLGAADATE